MHHFSYQRYQNQNQYQCMSNNCICVGNKDTCTCYKNTSSCFCENFHNNITIPTAVSPVYDCGLYNDTYICTGARYRMYCNTSVHDFHYSKNHYHCLNNNCSCIGNKDNCTCSSNTSSCFCETNSKSIPAAVSPVYDCGLYNDTYICTGAQHRMYCNSRLHSFYYQRYRYPNQNLYECWSNNCNCVGYKDTCTCSSSTLSSCFCETYGNNITVPTAVSPVTDPDCVLQNNMYICTGAQYRMYCNTQMHDFSYQNYQFQHQYQCVNNNCDCVGNKDTCTCSSSTLSSCFCETYGNTIALTTAVTPVYGCVLYNDTSYICTGTQYHMYCNTSVHDFHYDTYHDHCFINNCNCIGNKDTCTCYYNMSSSCFCANYNNSITIPAAVSPVYDCGLYNDTYICTGAQHRMYCNTRMHYFYYLKYQYQDQYACVSNDCICVGHKDTCTCSSSTLSSCFCEPYGNIVALNRAVAPAYGCVLYNDTYICTGAQYHMYCNTRMNYFYYLKYQYQDYYLCMSDDCTCVGHKDTCTCSSSTLSSCFCETYNNSVTIPTAVSPLRLSQCVFFNDKYICTGAQYRMHCNTSVHDFYYFYQNQNQYQYQCWNNNCNCVGNKDTCTCSSSTLSSCFCETYGNTIALMTAVTPVYGCVLYNNTSYICTGAQYHMYCNTSVHDFHYDTYHYHCLNNNCNCIGYKDTCTCSSSTLSSCFCEPYGNIVALNRAVAPAYGCVLYNDTYICTGAQYRMYCNTRMHDFYYWKYQYQNQFQYECWSNNCACVGHKDTCTCSSSTLSSCFCETYNNSITIPTAVSPLRVSQCVLFNDTYICTGAQYRIHCNTSTHDFYYWRYRYQDQYLCISNDCYCVGDKETCTCYYSTLSSCFCETYGNTIALTTAVTPVYDCVLYSDTSYICTGAQYHMYCNTSVNDFHYDKYHYHCLNNNCNCIGNKDTCTCYYNMSSSCFCANYNNSITIPTAVSPVYDCGLYNDTYICTGAQYRMYCNTRMYYFNYQRYRYSNQYQYECWNYNCDCVANQDTCTCYSSTLSSCFCETYGNITALNRAVAPAYGCVFYNDTYICTGAQYHMYCNTRMHNFYYWRYQYQNQDQDQYLCMSTGCICVGDKDTCTCYSSTLSSCFCETYTNSITIPTAVSSLRLSQCVFFNDTYICTGAQYRMHCNTRMHYFNYRRYRNQNQYEYQCWGDNCACTGNNDTCTCYSSTAISCFCEYNIFTPTTLTPTTTTTLSPTSTSTLTSTTTITLTPTTTTTLSPTSTTTMTSTSTTTLTPTTTTTLTPTTTTTLTSTTTTTLTSTTTTTLTSTTTGLDNMLDQCRNQTAGRCFQNLLDQIENITNQELPLDTVTEILTMAINASENILESSSSVSPAELASYGNRVLKTSEKLISTLVKPTDMSANVSFTLPTVEGQVFMVGPHVTLDKIPRLDTTSSSVDIDLIGIAKNNKGSAAVAFLSYNTMENLLKPDFFNTSNDTVKTMMSTVISVTLPKTTNTKLTKPVNFTLKHIRDSNPSGSLSCVYWNTSEWIVDGCSVLETNSSYTVCSCVHLSTFALVQTSSSSESNPPLDLLTWVSVILGLLFLSVGLLIFALCRWTRMSDQICGHSRCVRLVPEGYVREL
ncbi:hypothetical protein ABG768_021930 [Culter alburnus]|uniref:GAIN-B domain-containing protein n=1 Tax=Culter alburnus TaxID=194366 RepID=A0AAW2AXA7_CULAL